MIEQELLLYVQAALVAFFVNVIPAFVPPTWIVLSLYKINNPQLNSIILALFGVVGSVGGRFVMYLYSRILGRFVPQKYAENLNYFAQLIGGKKRGLFVGTFIYALSPLPSNFLFIASGVSAIEVLPVLAGFALGRVISYASLAYMSYRVSFFFGTLGIGNVRFLADLVGVLAAVSIIFIDWRKIFKRQEKW